MSLHSPLRQNPNRAYKMLAGKLEKLGINSIEDFLYHIPSRYDDYSVISDINKIQPGETVTIQGTILEFKNQYLRSKRIRTIQKATVSDSTGTIELVWFNQPFLSKSLEKNSKISASGRVEKSAKKISMQSPDFEILYNETDKPIHTARLVPVYPETKGLTSKWLRRQTHKILLEYKDELNDYLPENILKQNNFINLPQALQEIHFPRDENLANKARERLSFDELFLIQLAGINRRKEWQKNNLGTPLAIEKYQNDLDKFISSLPFKLTKAQQKATKEILDDLKK